MADPRCPRCGRTSKTPASTTPHAWYCHACRMEFEDVDDGTIAYGAPSKRLEREERRGRRTR